jgi:hypothetical protein
MNVQQQTPASTSVILTLYVPTQMDPTFVLVRADILETGKLNAKVRTKYDLLVSIMMNRLSKTQPPMYSKMYRTMYSKMYRTKFKTRSATNLLLNLSWHYLLHLTL